jgi:hypothetical protein
MANAATTVESVWDCTGSFESHFTAGDDAISDFWTAGSSISGRYVATDEDNNPYNYGVDTVRAQVEAEVNDGGFMEFRNMRTDSKESMYGSAGEVSSTYIESSGYASMKFRTRMAFAELMSSNCGWNSNDHFTASGDYFYIEHSLYDDTGEGAWIKNGGNGSTEIDLMSESTWGKTGSLKFGKGCGCYTNADITATGSGLFEVGAIAENQINVDALPITMNGDGTLGSVQYKLGVSYADGFNFGNFALDLN